MQLKRKVLVFFLTFCITSTFGQVRGNATYYSKHSNGKRMSNGSRYNRDSMTCAHRSYPLGTLLKVTNIESGTEIIVKVTDRGPFRRNRLIDISYGAAKKLGILSKGISLVEVEPYEKTIVPYRIEEEIPLFDLEVTDNYKGGLHNWNDIYHSPKEVKEKIKAEVKPIKIVTNKNGKEKK